MKLEIGNIYTQITGTRQERAWVDSIYTLSVPGAIFSGAFKSSGWDGAFHFFQNDVLLTGLVPRLRRMAREMEIEVEVEDLREVPGLPSAIPTELLDSKEGKILLREDQLTAAEVLLSKTRGILDSPTGAGKTEIFISILMALLSVKGRLVILVHSKELVKQWLMRMRERGIPEEKLGKITSDDWLPNKITVVMTPTLRSRMDNPEAQSFLQSISVVLVEECQLGGAERYLTLLGEMDNAYYRFGFSATPVEYEGIRNYKLIGSLGPLRHSISSLVLTEEGVLPEVIYHSIRLPRTGNTQPPADWDGLKRCKFFYDEYLNRNFLLRYLINQSVNRFYSKTQALIVINSIEHGNYLAAGIDNAEFISGQTKQKERDGTIERYSAGELRVLITSPILDYGLDVKNIGLIWLAGGYESAIRLVQRIGRGRRKKESGENLLHVFDPYFEDIPYLEEHSIERLNTIKNKFPEITICSTI